VVTASHNPPQDNGYKVYLGDGSQIVPPADARDLGPDRRDRRWRLQDVPRARVLSGAGRRTRHGVPGSGSPRWSRPTRPRSLNWVYTPLHGVGGAIVDRAIATSGFDPAGRRGEQAAPDPRLPHRRVPEPEEPGAIDLALALAEDEGADLVVANDPDADRCAVAAPIDGRWRMLRGDELGCLLGDDALRRGVRGTYACSIVSSSLLSVMAARVRAAVRLHLDRLQVDRPGARTGVRLRGGHRLLRRPGVGAGQGRRSPP
jgi:phosphomannomutase